MTVMQFVNRLAKPIMILRFAQAKLNSSKWNITISAKQRRAWTKQVEESEASIIAIVRTFASYLGDTL